MMIIDNIFGNVIEPDPRVARHSLDLAGVKHLHRTVPLDPVPGEPMSVILTTSGALPFQAACGWYTLEPPSSAVPPAALSGAFELRPNGAAWDTVTWGYVRRWMGTLPALPSGTMLRYRLGARLASAGAVEVAHWVFADNQAETVEAATEFAIWIDDGGLPDWARSAMVYHVFLDRFNPGEGRQWLKPATLSGFFGGTLRGVIEKLDYIRDLGFNALWLSPLFASPTHHGYDATDLYTVEPRLGTNADLQELIEGAHARGLRIIMDFVANHWSSQHPSFQAALRDPDSSYHDWYTWKHWPDDYESYFGVMELPQLNLKRGGARDYLLKCARYWLGQGVDGYRLDFAYGPSHDFWSDFQRACRTARPDCWLFGEVIHTPEVQRSYAGRLDGSLDFLLASALRETFARGNWDLTRFEAFLAAHEAFFPATFSRPAFLDNHDMNRILFMAGDDQAKVRLAALVLFTLMGPLIVYYGTEVGLTQERPIHQNDFGLFEEARLPMNWAPAQAGVALRDYFRRLLHLRQAYPALLRGTRRALHVDREGGYAYVREGEGQTVLVALNLSDKPRSLVLAVDGLTTAAKDRLGDAQVRANGSEVVIDLPPMGGAWIA
jgi:cyclomaltodextrinase